MNVNISLLVFITTLTFYSGTLANEGHRIEIQFEGLQNEECYLAYHHGNRQYMQDTTMIGTDGMAVFEGADRLDPGLYLVVLEDDTNFELIIDRNQHFSVAADPGDIPGSLEFTNSPDNEMFYDYISFLTDKNQRRQPMEQELRDPATNPGREMEVRQEIEEMNEQVMQKQNQIIADDPEGLLALILKAQRDPEMPEPPLLPNGQQDIDAMYQIYKSRFFENIDFSDERLIYTPVYHSRLRVYFNNVIMQHPDSIISEADRVLDKARENREVFKYTVWFITNNAEASQVMGMDKVFVHMIENYYLTDEVDWVSEERLNQLRRRAEEIKPLLLGEIAPNLELQNAENEILELHEIEARYTILYFWDSECPHCLRAAPALKSAWEELKEEGVKVVAINTEQSRQNWIKAIDDYPDEWTHLHDTDGKARVLDTYSIYAIPQVYILDEDKKIIAKDIGVEHIAAFIKEDMRR